MGHVARMNSDRRANQVINWTLEGKRRRGRPRKNWMGTVQEDLRCLEMMVEHAIEVARDREEWKNCVARCADLHGKD